MPSSYSIKRRCCGFCLLQFVLHLLGEELFKHDYCRCDISSVLMSEPFGSESQKCVIPLTISIACIKNIVSAVHQNFTGVNRVVVKNGNHSTCFHMPPML